MANLMELVEALVNGIEVNGVRVRGVMRNGRFREEVNVNLYLGGSRLLSLKVFLGRGPYYGPWVEVFNVNESVWGLMDEHLINMIARHLGPGNVLYVEYLTDRETRVQLQRGYPPFLSRLGYIMVKAGFTWLKDWYYPEGWLEGGPKLEGQLPLNNLEAEAQWGKVRKEAWGFLKGSGGVDEYWVKAVERAKAIVEGRVVPIQYGGAY